MTYKIYIPILVTMLLLMTKKVKSEELKCLTVEQIEEIKKAVKELDNIHNSKAEVTVTDEITIIQDWDGRVYVNGGDTKPLKAKLKIGDYVDRDLELTLKTKVYYRPAPPDPMFRLRFRAQLCVLSIVAYNNLKNGSKDNPFDASLGLDFFHIGIVNASIFAGVQSLGAGIGMDITKNFGAFAGYSLTYQ